MHHRDSALSGRAVAMKFLSITQRLSLIVGLLVLHRIGVNQMAVETGAAADQLLASADDLGKQAAILRGDVDNAKSRAA
jgi:hypothetical protein